MRQAQSWSCGAAVVQSMLAYWGKFDGPEADLWGLLETSPETGTEPDMMVKVLRLHGLRSRYHVNATRAHLRRWLRSGATVAVAIQAWPDEYVGDWSQRWDDGHWVVVVGMTRTDVIVMDPSVVNRYATIPTDEFDHRWHDDDRSLRTFGMAVVCKGSVVQDFSGLARCG